MKVSKTIFLFLVALVIAGILLNQLFWVVNMYKAYQRDLVLTIDDGMERALKMEVTERINDLHAPVIMRFSPVDSTEKETPTLMERKVQTEDTTIYIMVDKNDPNIEYQNLQFFLIKDNPVNLDNLNRYFRASLEDKGFSIRNSYMEYYDLTKHVLIKQNKPTGWFSMSVITTDTIPLDILKSVGVRAFVAASPRPILEKMAYQLALSLVLFLFATYSLIFLLRTIIRQRKLEKMRQDFVNAMVHEFKRPITNAGMMLELVPMYLAQGDREKAEGYIAGSLTEFKKLTAYTDRIQRISNNDKEKIRLEKTADPLAAFFDRLKNEHADNHHKTVAISITVETVRKNLYVDALHFSNVMDNLVENAIKYSDDPVQIVIALKDAEGSLEISVTDDGYGIPDRDKKQIFDKFYRAVPKQGRKVTGFGLGLTYVKAIVEAHGGTIRVMDAPVKGSVFVINIPV